MAKKPNVHNAGDSALSAPDSLAGIRQAPQDRNQMSVPWPTSDGAKPAPYEWPGEGSPAGAVSFHVDDVAGR